MISFSITKKSKKSRARLGVIKTPHRKIQTPAFINVATQATIKALLTKDLYNAGTQAIICNTFHLHLKPGEGVVEKNGGIHKFMQWKNPIMTDSGGFQVFSLGFGRDYGTGKILKQDTNIRTYSNDTNKYENKVIKHGEKPKNILITKRGVWFRSPVDNRKLFIGPEESIHIQQKLGADIIFAFDECNSPLADYEYNKKSLERTHDWAKICLQTNSSNKHNRQALFGIVQGGKYKDLRIQSAKFIGSLPFDGFGIGGEFGNSKKIMGQMLSWVTRELPEEKPRHLLGIGQLEDIPIIIKEGVDTFDCTVPTHYARNGYVFISQKSKIKREKRDLTKHEKVDLSRARYLNDLKPLDENCNCFVCKTYTRSYLSHLIKAREISGMSLLTFHNIHFFNKFVETIRNKIRKNQI